MATLSKHHHHYLSSTLTSSVSRRIDFRCDICSSTGDIVYCCDSCNWDICRACLGSELTDKIAEAVRIKDEAQKLAARLKSAAELEKAEAKRLKAEAQSELSEAVRSRRKAEAEENEASRIRSAAQNDAIRLKAEAARIMAQAESRLRNASEAEDAVLLQQSKYVREYLSQAGVTLQLGTAAAKRLCKEHDIDTFHKVEVSWARGTLSDELDASGLENDKINLVLSKLLSANLMSFGASQVLNCSTQIHEESYF